MTPIRIGLIGAGFIGAIHARALSALREAKLVAVADLQVDRARALASPTGGSAYADYGEMFSKEKLDAQLNALVYELDSMKGESLGESRRRETWPGFSRLIQIVNI